MVIPVDSPPGLLEFLCQRFPRIGPGIWRKRLLQGRVLDARHQPLPVDAGCHGGQVIYYFRELEHEPQVPFREDILFENEHLVVVDKPHFLATAPVGNYVEQTVLHRLQQRLQLPELTPVHRLDRLTAGVLLLCKQPHERDTYQALFRRQQVDKVYEALAAPLPQLQFPHLRRSRIISDDVHFFRSREVAGEANSETRIEVLARYRHHWHYRLLPLSGRKHQLRVHLSALGAPIVGDDFYPQPLRRAADDFSRPLQLLARSLAFTDPLTGAEMLFASRRDLPGPDELTVQA
ncbi:tRNA pseudouridine32 synthase/23S rRNA pseudouridine746 synthase [Thiopseudomonas denitrificans]|uniref:tRNA pseudouridine32 synthase/23S rRNA pseudouridine746 synthase n=1 Tax=Thiopseudomonas denitrificans TaxID=1501432 RepID=A0A4R6U5X4_9GAMM|nr:tRNA pseudouridine32 synthase/23S rRNA pseudouridine746 synthase [Thiopseudomonas denitrificans]